MTTKKYQTIINENYNLETFEKEINNHYNNLKEEGNYFLLTDSLKIDDDFIYPYSFDMTKKLLNIGFDYINTIIAIRDDSKKQDDILTNKFYFVLWFVKNNDKMYFDKDPIREKHIWKDVEWGKRSKNYHSKGKDPGNVWIPTEDDGKGNITEHIIMDKSEVIKRCIISTTRRNDKVLLKSNANPSYSDLEIEVDHETVEYVPKIRRINKNNNNNKSNKKTNALNANVHFKSSEMMEELNSKSIDLMVTSPPYWNLKDYYKENQIGYNESYENYLDRIKNVLKESYRVLKDKGNMWINIDRRTKNKKPILMPQDITEISLSLGFKLVDIIIWHKSSGIPTHKNNIVRRFEYFLWFAKDKDFNYYTDNIRDIKDYENNKLNGGNIWNINRKAGSVGKNFVHPAIYPVKLINRIIKLCTIEKDTVLDPFLGSGTSLISSLINNRNFIGYEYNEKFHDLIKHRFQKEVVENLDFNLFNNELRNKKFKIDFNFHGNEKKKMNIKR